MKTAKEWREKWPEAKWEEYTQDQLEFIEAIQADAREQGRREGLEEAAKVCEKLTRLFVGRDDALGAQYACVEAVRKLLEGKP